MMEYRTIFKCRLCGEVYEGGCTSSQSVAMKAITLACLGMPSEAQAPTLIEPHSCKNGGLGVADFQGFRKVEKKMSIVEYSEKNFGIDLWPFQKQFLQKLEKLPSGSRLISTPRGMMIVKDSKMKEDQ